MKDNYGLFPTKHILPYDGMSITSGVWDEAHNYHIQMQNAHQYFLHDTGIVAGLEVVASDPPDNVVFVLPGVAIDTAGRMIVLPEAVAYDLGEKISGKLHLMLLHREVKIQATKNEENNIPGYMQDEFVIVARADDLDVPHVEIARIFRDNIKAPIHDAENPNAPQPNAIDLRFRKYVCPPPVEQVLAGVCYLGNVPEKNYDKALIHLAKPLEDASPYRLIVENDIPLKQDIFNYQLIYLVATGTAKLDDSQAETLQNYIHNDGKVLIEFCERVTDENVPALLQSMSITFDKVPSSHAVFHTPYLFIFPPQGSFPKENVTLWYGEPGVFCTNGGYGSIWSGELKQASFTREIVRSALEWGVNILTNLLGK